MYEASQNDKIFKGLFLLYFTLLPQNFAWVFRTLIVSERFMPVKISSSDAWRKRLSSPLYVDNLVQKVGGVINWTLDFSKASLPIFASVDGVNK